MTLGWLFLPSLGFSCSFWETFHHHTPQKSIRVRLFLREFIFSLVDHLAHFLIFSFIPLDFFFLLAGPSPYQNRGWERAHFRHKIYLLFLMGRIYEGEEKIKTLSYHFIFITLNIGVHQHAYFIHTKLGCISHQDVFWLQCRWCALAVL